MSPLEQFIDEVEVSITDAVDALDGEQSARLYAEVLDMEQRLEALRDVLSLLAPSRDDCVTKPRSPIEGCGSWVPRRPVSSRRGAAGWRR